MAEPPSSPPSDAASAEEQLSWYKLQYEQLEHELADFRDSSRELEKELEKDIEEAEKRERTLQERAETLVFEVEEWKRKYKEAKNEATTAQNALEKEITTLRDSNRTLQLRLRDIEVANDDFERQARNTTSSLEDLESKYNVAIERGVMMEEEIKLGEQEREQIRIEAQRLKEELADLKIEAELLQDKVKKYESRHLSAISTDLSLLESPTFDRNGDNSPGSTASSPLITTPPDTKELETKESTGSAPEIHDPPSPPMSDASAPLPKAKAPAPRTPAAPVQRKSRLPSADSSVTPKPRPKNFSSSISRPRVATSTPSTRTPATKTPGTRSTSHKMPASNSLSHVRSLREQVRQLEKHVHSVRSKLPAPTHTPPRPSPGSSLHGGLPSTVTIRSKKRATGSTASSSVAGEDTTPTNPTQPKGTTSKHIPRLSTSGISRLSFGPLPNRNPGGVDSDASLSRPSSRASISSYARPASRTDMNPPPRPISRASLSGSRTPLGRPRSSLGGSLHGHSASISQLDADDDDAEFRTPSRRGTYSRFEIEGSMSGIPAPSSGIPMPSGRRQSGGGGVVGNTGTGRRISSGANLRDSTSRRLDDVGETY